MTQGRAGALGERPGRGEGGGGRGAPARALGPPIL